MQHIAVIVSHHKIFYCEGNGWGVCPDGHGALGCGPQETFVNCADVSIHSNTGSGFGPPQSALSGSNNINGDSSNQVHHEDRHKQNPYLMYYRDYSTKGTPIVPLVVR